jgi:hypothetical protein
MNGAGPERRLLAERWRLKAWGLKPEAGLRIRQVCTTLEHWGVRRDGHTRNKVKFINNLGADDNGAGIAVLKAWLDVYPLRPGCL